MLVPGENPVSDPVPLNRAPERESCGKDSGEKDILVSVHLEDGCGMSRAEEIFDRAGSDSPFSVPVEDESPHSWVKPLFARNLR
jgi:hypothetical protein